MRRSVKEQLMNHSTSSVEIMTSAICDPPPMGQVSFTDFSGVESETTSYRKVLSLASCPCRAAGTGAT
ncbi:hypothetical protein TSMEX_004224 [Taenia solium]